MESTQREIIAVLLKRVYESGLITESVYSKAADLVYSAIDFPEFLQYTVCSEKEAEALEYTENPRGDAKRENDI